MLAICHDLFSSWNCKGVRYCHWKSNEHLMEGLDGITDLDIFVQESDREIAEEELTRNKYKKCIPQCSSRYPKVDEWIGFDNQTGKLVHVHLHYQVVTGTKYCKEYVFPIDNYLIETRIQDEETEVFVAMPELEIIILYCRIVLKAANKKHIIPSQDYTKEIDYLQQRINYSKLLEVCCALFVSNANDIYSLLIQQTLSYDEWYRVFLIADSWLQPYRKYSKMETRIRYWFYRYLNIFAAVSNSKLHTNFIRRKTFAPTGLSVCFLGADGSGKSTISFEIEKWLKWKVDAKRFYLGSGDHYNSILKKILSRARKVSLEKRLSSNVATKETIARKHQISLKKRILKCGYSILQSIYMCEIAAHSLKQIKAADRYAKKGAIAVLDRFPQNQFAGIYDGPKIAMRYLEDGSKNILIRMLAKMEESLIEQAQRYQPSMVIKLHLTPEEAIKRKSDHSIEEVTPKTQITPQLVFANSRVYDVDAEMNYEAEIIEIKQHIWREIVR